MRYTIKAHPTMYAGVQFRSRLEARWAVFFDLAGWSWEYEPIDLPGWSPDFRVEFPCKHSECNGSHILLAEVKPYFAFCEFEGHPCLDYPYGCKRLSGCDTEVARIPADSSAAFGANPSVSWWEMGHGAGGGEETIDNWVWGAAGLWAEAGNVTQWKPRRFFANGR